MTIENKELPIGVFDSGVGGISVLGDLMHILPGERYIYFGDSGNAPYGVRQTEEIKELTFKVARHLMELGIKALVVACNTATSAAIDELRETLSIPVVGMEPALKPAVEFHKPGKIVVMATPVTLREKKFNQLIHRFHEEADVIKLPCPGLVEIIEKSGAHSPALDDYLEDAFSQVPIDEVHSIVLGCTHYVFIKEAIKKQVGSRIALVDGNRGTANRLATLLGEENRLQEELHKGKCTEVRLINSSTNIGMLQLSKSLLQERLHALDFTGCVEYIGGK